MDRSTFSQSLNPDKSIKPSFSVHKNGTNQTIGSAYVILTWSTEEFDTNNNFTSNRFTPTISGKYLIQATIRFSIAFTADIIWVAIYKNGVLYKESTHAAPNQSSVNLPVSDVIDANGTTDYFEIWVKNANNADTIEGGATLTYFSGCKID